MSKKGKRYGHSSYKLIGGKLHQGHAMPDNSDTYTLRLLRDDDDDAAIKVHDPSAGEFWLPRSKIEYKPSKITGHIEVEIPDWLAIEKRLI